MANNIKECQEILLQWLCIKEKVSYQIIAKKCEYLNIQYDLKIDKHPIRKIFFPLFMTGNVEMCGDMSFKVVPPLCIEKNGNHIYTNIVKTPNEKETGFPFILTSSSKSSMASVTKYYCFDAVSTLKCFPKIDQIVNSFTVLPENDFSSLVFVDSAKLYGIAKKEALYSCWFFVYPKTMKICSIPNWTKQPDALNIAYCYYRVLSGEKNATYYAIKRELRIRQFHCPIQIYRILLLESLINKGTPYSENGFYVFPNIDKPIVSELNRILLKSVHYE